MIDALGTLGAVLLLVGLYVGLGVWIFAAVILVAVTGLVLIAGYPVQRVGLLLQTSVWNSATAWELSAIPLFMWMGEILLRTDITERLFRGLVPLLDRVPGRLLHTNVLGCTAFAAVSGSSTATTAAIGKITTRALADRKYSRVLSLGSLAGSGTLGIMIPPSIPMIVYGVLAEVSVTKLFVAGLLPGLILAGLYSVYIAACSLAMPGVAPPDPPRAAAVTARQVASDLAPVASLIAVIMGGIYSGLATPSEAAALGVAWAIVLTVAMGRASWRLLWETLLVSTRASCMLCIIIVGASFLSAATGLLHLPQEAAEAIGKLSLSPAGLILILTLVYIVLGCLFDGVSMIVMTLPIVLPMITKAGFDPIWFGVYLVLVIEMAMVTPPVGFNLFVIKSLTGEPIGRVGLYAFPFFVLMCLATAMLVIYPELALWLPRTLLE